MLVERKTMNIFTKAAHIVWEDEEWDLVASELKRQNPRRQTDNFNRLDFTTMEVEDAAEMVLGQERQRSYDSLNPIRRNLFDAFQRIKKNGPQATPKIEEGNVNSNGVVSWSVAEYQAIMNELYRLSPTNFDNRCKLVNIAMMRRAMEILEPHRRRKFKQLVTFRETLTRMWEKDQAAKISQPKLAKVEFTKGVIAEPAPKKSDGYNAVASAMHNAFQNPSVEKKGSKPRKAHVTWSPSDWVLLAREMRRQNPHINFFASKFVIIDLPALRDAQRNIFPIEHRRALSGTQGLQAHLVDAFRTLRIQLDNEREVEDRAKLAAKIDEKVHVEPEKVHKKTAETSPTNPRGDEISADGNPKLAMNSAGCSEEASFLSEAMAAAVPLVELLMREFIKQTQAALIPELTKAFRTCLEGVKAPAWVDYTAPVSASAPAEKIPAPIVQQPTQDVVNASVSVISEMPQRMTAAAVAAFNNITPKPKKQKIALLGPMGKQKADIESSFPQYKFVFIQNGHAIREAAADSVLFLAYNSHLNAHAKSAIKLHVPFDKIRYIEGSLTSVKRQIVVWEASKNGG